MNKITPDTLMVQMRAMATQVQGMNTNNVETKDNLITNNFSEILKNSIKSVNESQAEAKHLAAAFEQGDKNIQLSQVMISMQKANISFQAMLEVRNKLVSAYQDIMNMQV